MKKEKIPNEENNYRPSETSAEEYGILDYLHDFKSNKEIQKSAFDLAHGIRKFEIDLYWKRAAYFWAFISVALAGFALVESKDFASKKMLSLLLACTGFTFSLGWLMVNRGSKYWQENWENHVDNLEDDFVGPLYKVTLSRPRPHDFDEKLKHYLTGPSKFSVSKINQMISLYVTMLWIVLITHSLLPISLDLDFDEIQFSIVMITVVNAFAFYRYGRTHTRPMRQVISKRDVNFHIHQEKDK